MSAGTYTCATMEMNDLSKFGEKGGLQLKRYNHEEVENYLCRGSREIFHELTRKGYDIEMNEIGALDIASTEVDDAYLKQRYEYLMQCLLFK